MNTTKQLANRLYTAYCEAVGGVAFNNEPLPDWETFAADPAKQKQAKAWETVASEVLQGACKSNSDTLHKVYAIRQEAVRYHNLWLEACDQLEKLEKGETPGMDFGTALQCIKDGQEVWRGGCPINLDNLHLVTRVDMLAEDWEVLEPVV